MHVKGRDGQATLTVIVLAILAKAIRRPAVWNAEQKLHYSNEINNVGRDVFQNISADDPDGPWDYSETHFSGMIPFPVRKRGCRVLGQEREFLGKRGFLGKAGRNACRPRLHSPLSDNGRSEANRILGVFASACNSANQDYARTQVGGRHS